VPGVPDSELSISIQASLLGEVFALLDPNPKPFKAIEKSPIDGKGCAPLLIVPFFLE